MWRLNENVEFLSRYIETFEKCSILCQFKKDDPATGGINQSIQGVFRGLKFESDAELVQKGAFFKGLACNRRGGAVLFSVVDPSVKV